VASCMHAPSRRLAWIVKLIGHTKYTDAAHGCPVLARADEVIEQRSPNVRFWPIADMPLALPNVRFWG
jgi:hypothetical protein